jgi:hypothetical protein
LLVICDVATKKPTLQRLFKPVNKIFRRAGEIRNAHINLKLVAKYKLQNAAFPDSQRLIIEKGLANFKMNGPKYIKRIDRSQRAIASHLHFAKKKTLRKFYQQQLSAIARELEATAFNEDLHESRKKIKLLVYNQAIAENAMKDKLVFNGQYMDDLQAAIGDWHDNVLAIDIFSAGNLNDEPVAKRIKRKNLILEKKIKEMSEDFLKKATSRKEEPKITERNNNPQ